MLASMQFMRLCHNCKTRSASAADAKVILASGSTTTAGGLLAAAPAATPAPTPATTGLAEYRSLMVNAASPCVVTKVLCTMVMQCLMVAAAAGRCGGSSDGSEDVEAPLAVAAVP
jgi:hypothetical protein